MLTREQQGTKSAAWLARWQGWQGSAVSMAQYAREQGFDAQEGYRWKRILQRTGQWVATDVGATVAAPKKAKVAARFARVAVSDPPTPCTSMRLRLVLGNGRRAELEVFGMSQLTELIGVLERAA